MTSKMTNKSTKGVTVVTYIIALLCLLAGLIAPLYGTSGSFTDKMLLLHIPDALNVAFGKQIIKGEWLKPFGDVLPAVFFGKHFQLLAYALVIYTIVTVLGVIFLIPVLAGKKMRKTSAACAYFIELAALIPLALYLIYYMAFTPAGGWQNYAVVVAFLGTVAMVIVQSIDQKKGMGVAKTFLFLFSLIAALSLYDLVAWMPSLSGMLNGMANSFKMPAGFTEGMAGIAYALVYGLNPSVLNPVMGALDAKGKLMMIALIATSLIALINLIIDIIGLATNGRFKNGKLALNAGSKVFGIIRYGLELVAAIFAIVMAFVAGAKPGLLLYLLTAMALVQTIIEVARTCMMGRIRKANAAIDEQAKNAEQAKADDKAKAENKDAKPEEKKEGAVKDENKDAKPEEKKDGEPDYKGASHNKEYIQPLKYDLPKDGENKTASSGPFKGKPKQRYEYTSYVPDPITPYPDPVAPTTPPPPPASTTRFKAYPAGSRPNQRYQQPQYPQYQQPAQPQYPQYQQPAQPQYPQYQQPAQPQYPQYQQPVQPQYQQPVPPQQPPQPQYPQPNAASSEPTMYYNVKAVYDGPTDSFLNTLTDPQKIEFVKTFVQKVKGPLGDVPDYDIGGDNAEFFRSVFIYLAKFRNTVSSGLLAKIYKQVNNFKQ